MTTLFTPYSCVAQEFGLSHDCVDQPRAPLNVPSVPHNTHLEFLSAVPLTGWDRLEGSDSFSHVWLLGRRGRKSLRAYPATRGSKSECFKRQEVETADLLSPQPADYVASLLLCSIGSGSHRTHPHARVRDIHTTSQRGTWSKNCGHL